MTSPDLPPGRGSKLTGRPGTQEFSPPPARFGLIARSFIMDMHTHFLRDDTRIMTFVN